MPLKTDPPLPPSHLRWLDESLTSSERIHHLLYYVQHLPVNLSHAEKVILLLIYEAVQEAYDHDSDDSD